MRGDTWWGWGAMMGLLVGMADAQDRPVGAIDKMVMEKAVKEGVQATWTPDFRWSWPEAKANFRDIFIAEGTDAMALGYYLDDRSISPKGFYGVIVPRYGGGIAGRNFLVELLKRRIVGVLDGPSFAFPPKARASWSYRWAPDGASLVIEQAHAGEKGWERDGLRMVELHEDQIVRQSDLLKEPKKIPQWVDVTQPPGEVRSFPTPPKAPLVLAESSVEDDCWKVHREATVGSLQMFRGDKLIGTLPPVKALAEDSSGKIREMSSDEIPGLPLCFFSPDEKWLFVNQIVRENPNTGALNRIGFLYRRKDGAEGVAPTWELATSKRADEMAWQLFSAEEKIDDARIGPRDAAGWSDRTMEFVAWSQDSGRLLLGLRAGNGVESGKDEKPASYRWFCYFNTQKGAFETDGQLSSTNEDLRPRWPTSDESLIERRVPLRAAGLGQMSFFAPPSEMTNSADRDLNTAYKALIARTQAAAVEDIRNEQRAWLKYLDTLAWVHVAQRWTRFTDAVLTEGRFLAMRVRADDLSEGAIKAKPGPNTVIRDKSPDGKFGVLYTYAEDDLAHEGRIEGMELLELAAKRVVLDLYDEVSNRSLAVLWAPDSQHFAFHCASRRVGEFTIYERKGNDFVALKSPDLHRFSPKLGKGEQEGHFNGADNEPKRWLGSKRLLIDYSINFDTEKSNGGQGMAEAYYDIIVAIDAKGGVVVEKATKKKPPE